HRPGHFQGVTQVVHCLFDIVRPHLACFGQKDFQQVLVIQRMLEITQMPVELLICPTIRDEHGLALSSRNVRLSPEGKTKALVLTRAVRTVNELFETISPQELRDVGKEIIAQKCDVELEDFAIGETRSLDETTCIIDGKQYV